MRISDLLRFPLRQAQFGVVEVGGGAAVVDMPDGDAADDGAADDDGQDGAVAEEIEAGEAGAAAGAAAVSGGDAAAAADAAGELEISIGDEPAADEDDAARAPEWIRELRRSNREKDRRIRELEQKVATATPAQQDVVVGPEPELEEFADAAAIAKYKVDLAAWHDRKRQADEQQRTRERAESQQRAHWQSRLDAVHKAVSTLQVKDYDEVAEAFEDLFPSLVQRGIIMGGPDDPKTSALLRYALGKNPKKARELAAITDPVKFAFAVAKLEEKLKVTPRKAAPAPDTVVRSSVAGSAAIDNTLKRLQAEADKTGDRSKVAAYIRQQRHKQAA